MGWSLVALIREALGLSICAGDHAVVYASHVAARPESFAFFSFVEKRLGGFAGRCS